MASIEKIKARNIKSFLKSVEKHGEILSLSEMYARGSSQNTDKILLGILDTISPLIKKGDGNVLVMCLYEVDRDYNKGRLYRLVAFNDCAVYLKRAHLHKGAFLAFSSVVVEKFTCFRRPPNFHKLQVRIGDTSEEESKIFYCRKSDGIVRNCIQTPSSRSALTMIQAPPVISRAVPNNSIQGLSSEYIESFNSPSASSSGYTTPPLSTVASSVSSATNSPKAQKQCSSPSSSPGTTMSDTSDTHKLPAPFTLTAQKFPVLHNAQRQPSAVVMPENTSTFCGSRLQSKNTKLANINSMEAVPTNSVQGSASDCIASVSSAAISPKAQKQPTPDSSPPKIQKHTVSPTKKRAETTVPHTSETHKLPAPSAHAVPLTILTQSESSRTVPPKSQKHPTLASSSPKSKKPSESVTNNGQGQNAPTQSSTVVPENTSTSYRSRLQYKYTKLADINSTEARLNLYGVVSTITKFSNEHAAVRIRDESLPDDQDFRIHIFFKRDGKCPKIEPWCILRFHRVKIEYFFDKFDGRVFSGIDVVSFPPDGQGMEGAFTTADSFHFSDEDAKRVAELRAWIQQARKHSATKITSPPSTVNRTNEPSTNGNSPGSPPNQISIDRNSQRYPPNKPSTSRNSFWIPPGNTRRYPGEEINSMCVETGTQTPSLIEDIEQVDVSEEISTAIAALLRTNIRRPEIQLCDIKSEGCYTLLCQIVAVQTYSDRVLVLTVSDGTFCAFSNAAKDNCSDEHERDFYQVNITIRNPTREMKNLKLGSFVKLSGVVAIMVCTYSAQNDCFGLEFTTTGSNLEVNTVSESEEKAKNLIRRLERLNKIQEDCDLCDAVDERLELKDKEDKHKYPQPMDTDDVSNDSSHDSIVSLELRLCLEDFQNTQAEGSKEREKEDANVSIPAVTDHEVDKSNHNSQNALNGIIAEAFRLLSQSDNQNSGMSVAEEGSEAANKNISTPSDNNVSNGKDSWVQNADIRNLDHNYSRASQFTNSSDYSILCVFDKRENHSQNSSTEVDQNAIEKSVDGEKSTDADLIAERNEQAKTSDNDPVTRKTDILTPVESNSHIKATDTIPPGKNSEQSNTIDADPSVIFSFGNSHQAVDVLCRGPEDHADDSVQSFGGETSEFKGNTTSPVTRCRIMEAEAQDNCNNELTEQNMNETLPRNYCNLEGERTQNNSKTSSPLPSKENGLLKQREAATCSPNNELSQKLKKAFPLSPGTSLLPVISSRKDFAKALEDVYSKVCQIHLPGTANKGKAENPQEKASKDTQNNNKQPAEPADSQELLKELSTPNREIKQDSSTSIPLYPKSNQPRLKKPHEKISNLHSFLQDSIELSHEVETQMLTPKNKKGKRQLWTSIDDEGSLLQISVRSENADVSIHSLANYDCIGETIDDVSLTKIPLTPNEQGKRDALEKDNKVSVSIMQDEVMEDESSLDSSSNVSTTNSVNLSGIESMQMKIRYALLREDKASKNTVDSVDTGEHKSEETCGNSEMEKDEPFWKPNTTPKSDKVSPQNSAPRTRNRKLCNTSINEHSESDYSSDACSGISKKALGRPPKIRDTLLREGKDPKDIVYSVDIAEQKSKEACSSSEAENNEPSLKSNTTCKFDKVCPQNSTPRTRNRKLYNSSVDEHSESDYSSDTFSGIHKKARGRPPKIRDTLLRGEKALKDIVVSVDSTEQKSKVCGNSETEKNESSLKPNTTPKSTPNSAPRTRNTTLHNSSIDEHSESDYSSDAYSGICKKPRGRPPKRPCSVLTPTPKVNEKKIKLNVTTVDENTSGLEKTVTRKCSKEMQASHRLKRTSKVLMSVLKTKKRRFLDIRESSTSGSQNTADTCNEKQFSRRETRSLATGSGCDRKHVIRNENKTVEHSSSPVSTEDDDTGFKGWDINVIRNSSTKDIVTQTDSSVKQPLGSPINESIYSQHQFSSPDKNSVSSSKPTRNMKGSLKVESTRQLRSVHKTGESSSAEPESTRSESTDGKNRLFYSGSRSVASTRQLRSVHKINETGSVTESKSSDSAVQKNRIYCSEIKKVDGMRKADISYVKRNRKKETDIYFIEAWVTKVEPSISRDIVSGLCVSCRNLFNYNFLKGYKYCPECSNKGRRNLLKFMFLLRLHLLDESQETVIVTLCGLNAEMFLGLTSTDYLQYDLETKKVNDMLKQIVLPARGRANPYKWPLLKLLITPVRTSGGVEYTVHSSCLRYR